MEPDGKSSRLSFLNSLKLGLPLGLSVGLLCLFFILGPESALVWLGFAGNRPLSMPTSVAIDDRNQLYAVDGQRHRLLSFSQEGQLLWSLQGHALHAGDFQVGSVAARPTGGVIVSIEEASSGLRPAVHKLVAFSSEGQSEGVMVETSDEVLGSFEVVGEDLWYTSQTHGLVTVRARPAKALGPGSPESHRILFQVSLPMQGDLRQSLLHMPEGLIVTLGDGRLLVVDSLGRAWVPGFAAKGLLKSPWELKRGPNGSLVILDVVSRTVFSADSLDATALTPLWGQNEVYNMGRELPTFDSMGFSTSGTLAVADNFSGAVYVRPASGTPQVLTRLTPPEAEQALGWGLVLLGASVVVCVLWSLVGLYRLILGSRASILVKQLALLLPLLFVTGLLGTQGLYRWLDSKFGDQVRTKLTFAAGLGSKMIQGELIKAITDASDADGAQTRALAAQVQSLLESLGSPGPAAPQIRVLKYVDDTFFLVSPAQSGHGLLFPFGGNRTEYFSTARGGTSGYLSMADETGTRWAALEPLRSADGAIVGIVEVSVADFHDGLRRTYGESLASGFGQSLVAIVLVLLGTVALVVCISIATRRSRAEAPSPSQPKSLAGEAAMSPSQLEFFGRLTAIDQAVTGYVPTEWLTLMGKSADSGLESGDYVRRTVSIVFAQLSPVDTLDRAKASTGAIDRLIRGHGGVPLPSDGASYVAVFVRRGPEAALAARAILAALAQESVPVPVGLGVHSGPAKLGVRSWGGRLIPFLEARGLAMVRSLAHQALLEGGGVRISKDFTPKNGMMPS